MSENFLKNYRQVEPIVSMDIDNIGKTDNDFSFLSTVFDLVGNRDFINDYSNRLQSLQSVNNEKTNIWLSLSAISQQIGGTFQANVNNFIDNIINVDTCGTKGLESIAHILGTNYNVFSTLHNFPNEIIQLIDVLSIKKEYLVCTSQVKQYLAQFITTHCSVNISDTQSFRDLQKLNEARNDYILADSSISSEWIDSVQQFYNDNPQISNLNYKYSDYNANVNTNIVINTDAVDMYISATFYNMICQKLSATYNDSLNTTIFTDISDAILLSNFNLPNAYEEDMNILKLKYNISQKFNAEEEVDKIDNGQTKYDDYSAIEKKLLDLELKRRSDAFNSLELNTRYQYYKQKQVKDYYQFVTTEQNDFVNTYISSNIYDVDDQYFMLCADNTLSLLQLFTDPVNGRLHLDIKHEYVSNVVQKLLYIIQSVRDIRETLKFFCQKQFMKGTFLILSYLINEYLKSSTIYNANNIISRNDGIDASDLLRFDPALNYSYVINYIDPINYFNISTDADVSISDSTTADVTQLNDRYWESDSAVKSIGQIDTTNIFAIPPTINSKSFAFDLSALTDFYCGYLNIKFKNYKVKSLSQLSASDHLTQFLANVFDIGADKTTTDSEGNIVIQTDSALSAYKQDLYYRYTGNSNGENPFYYYSNTIHPSYQIHPCLCSFMELEDYSYPIENIATVAKDEIISLIKTQLTECIDEGGYLINMWKNPLGSNQDYLSRYETSDNLDTGLAYDPVVGYDGLFYLRAVDQLRWHNGDGLSVQSEMIYKQATDPNNSESLSILQQYDEETTVYTNYFHCVSLTEADARKKQNQLSVFYESILKEANNNDTDTHVIYKYGLDMYQNAYILVKKKIENDYLMQQEEPGTLWIRLKNQPIAFPAFVYKDATPSNTHQIDNMHAQFFEIQQNLNTLNETIDTNNVITNIAERAALADCDGYYVPKIYDFYFSDSKQDLILAYKEHSNEKLSFAIGTIVKTYDAITNENRLQFNRIVDNKQQQLAENLFVADNSNVKFSCFYNNNGNPGIIAYENITDESANDFSADKIKIHSAYFDQLSKVQSFRKIQPYVVTLDCPILPKENSSNKYHYNVCIDATNDNTMTLSYVGNTTLSSVKSYLGNEFTYSDSNKYAKYLTMLLDKCIVSKEFKIYNSIEEITIEDDNRDITHSQFFNCYTDSGFFGIFQNNSDNTISNDIANSYLKTELETRGILKFQLIGDSKGTNHIDFKLCLPVTMQEGYKDAAVVDRTIDSRYKFASYEKVHFLEDQVQAVNSSTTPYEMTDKGYFIPSEVNKLFNGNTVTIKVAEEYFQMMRDVVKTSQLNEDLQYRLFRDAGSGPYLFLETETGEGIEYTNFYNPTSVIDNTYVKGVDSYFIKIEDDIPMLSVSWFENNNTIGLNFNTCYFGTQLSDTFGSGEFDNNYYNEKRIFLNLDTPGDAGYLNMYSTESGNKGQYLATYYIKNISDERHPKFILADITKHKTQQGFLIVKHKGINGNLIYNEKNNTGRIIINS